ncbi:MAG: proline dehydrogenase [Deltaproteobacteria bacterium]|jgi:proline dehydrogenase|nr:proline dehydrogenase [Deltaproteobacteria bacterium]MBT4526923.1 proline dehydrogenase [Deltaproteobacteria bacterium]
MLNKLIAAILPVMPQKLIWLFSKRYIAGESLTTAIEAAKKLNQKGVLVTIDILGEFITTLDEAAKNRDEYLDMIETMEKENIDGNYSLKPTMFGLLIDQNICFEHIRSIVKKAAEYDNFIRIDMEDSQCVDLEIEIFRKIKAEFPKNVGLVVQAYLKRTLSDLQDMTDMQSDNNPVNFRLCKGIYVESPEIAYKNYQEINEHYLEDLEYMFKNNLYPGIATHDIPVVEGAYQLIEKYAIPKEKYEFQMLYGVRPELRQSILDKGNRVRVYIPYGKQWMGYSVRRIKENPKMASYILKALLFRG